MLHNGESILIPAFLMSAGLLCYTGIQAATMGLLGQNPRMRLAFSACCFCAAGYQVTSAFYYQAQSTTAAAEALHWQVSFIVLFFPAFFLCVADYTRQQRLRVPFVLITALFGVLLISNLLSPYSLRFDTLEASSSMRLPWGEDLARFHGQDSRANKITFLVSAAVLLWAGWRTARQYRQSKQHAALLLSLCIGLMLVGGVWGRLIDSGVIQSFYLSGFAFLAFAVLKNTGHAFDLRRRTNGMERSNRRLREEMARTEKFEHVIQQLREVVSSQTGEAYFQHLVEQLALRFKADYALIGLVNGPTQDSITTLAVWAHGAHADNLSYALAHTPCANVVGRKTCVYAQGVRALFPDDILAQAWAVESYVGTPLFDHEGHPLGILVVAGTRPLQDIAMLADAVEVFAVRVATEVCRIRAETERTEAESALRRSHALLQTLTETQRDFFFERDTWTTFERLLTPMLELSGSQYGFIGEVLYDESGHPYLKTHVYSKLSWGSASLPLHEKAWSNGLEFHHLHSLIGAVLTGGEAVIANHAPCDPRHGALPAGHPAIDSFLGLPVHLGDKLIGMLGIANRPGGYDGAVVADLQPFLSTCAALINAYRSGQMQRALETKLRESEERFRTLADSLPAMVWLADLDGHCTWFNRTWLAFTGRSLEGELARTWIDDVHPEDRQSCLSQYGEVIGTQSHRAVTQEYRLCRSDGEYRSILETMAPRLLPDGTVVGYVGACVDLTERRALEAQIQHLAYHDSLTGLPNRTLLLDRLAQAMRQADREGHQVAVLFSDFDRFKTINDTLGHRVGDALLCQTGERLKQVLRDGDTVARIGGDEFLILLPLVLAPQEAAHVAAKLLGALSVPFEILGHTLHVTASVGISLYPQDGNDEDTLIKHADIALYEAKGRGRNNYQLFNPGMNAMAHQRLLIENCLRQALPRNEFLLYYQPRIELATGKITGVEALIRWRHRERGLLAPGEFIAVAEEIGIIGDIGEWVLRVACQQAQAWRAEGLPALRMAVNVSAHQLRDQDFLERVERILLETGLPAACLDLELTESSVMADPEGSIATLGAIRRLGVHLSVDDFGTGYSSLAYLKRLPVDCLKIDRAFVSGIPDNAEDVAITQTVLAMAKTLNLSVVAEGMETVAQRDFLRSHGCDEGQGYLFSQPVAADKVSAILRQMHSQAQRGKVSADAVPAVALRSRVAG